ncbi:MAG: hypothetical protein AAF826_06185 [Pseudomonadota bacterium]
MIDNYITSLRSQLAEEKAKETDDKRTADFAEKQLTAASVERKQAEIYVRHCLSKEQTWKETFRECHKSYAARRQKIGEIEACLEEAGANFH